jgi:hypothetical protein
MSPTIPKVVASRADTACMENLILDWTPPAGTRWGTWQMKSLGLELRVDAQSGWLARSALGMWSIRRVGFHHPRTVVRPTGHLAELARVESGWDGHDRLEIVSGPTWDLDSTHPGQVILRDESGASLVRVSEPSGWGDTSGAHVVANPGLVQDRFGTLALLLSGYTFLERISDPTQTVVRGLLAARSVRGRFA